MLNVQQALELVIASTHPLIAERVSLELSLGLTLAEDVVSRVDSPPFSKSLMDGYAVRADDLTAGGTLDVIELVTAGQVPRLPVSAGRATQIMTGAPLPDGADWVVPVEETTREGDRVTFARGKAGKSNWLPRGATLKAGDVVLSAGRRLAAPQLAGLAELGEATVLARRRPTVAVLSTGDELVAVGETPGPGQIRNSNEVMLVAQSREAGAEPAGLGIARDNREDLDAKIRLGLTRDVLLLTGGVSAGMLDLVPQALAAAGVEKVFHHVAMKPGKPIWFGVRPAAGGRNACYVFGLPGNPVSSLVGLELFVRTALRCLAGDPAPLPVPVEATLTAPCAMEGNRATYHPAKLAWTSRGAEVGTVPWQGSADLRATLEANAMIAFPPGSRLWEAGERVSVFPWSAISAMM